MAQDTLRNDAGEGVTLPPRRKPSAAAGSATQLQQTNANGLAATDRQGHGLATGNTARRRSVSTTDDDDMMMRSPLMNLGFGWGGYGSMPSLYGAHPWGPGAMPMMPPPSWPMGGQPMVDDDQYDDDQPDDTVADDTAIDPVDLDGDQDVPDDADADEGDLLQAARARLADEDDGPPLTGQVAGVINDIWSEGRKPSVVKELCEKHPRPSNMDVHKLDMNDEVIAAVPKWARARDLRLRAIQGNIARASVPAARIIDGLYAKTSTMTKQEHVNLAMDAVTLLASANPEVNQLRREFLKPQLQRKYHNLCGKAPQDNGRLLFGDNSPDRVKEANTTGSLLNQGRRRGGATRRGGYHPYQQQYNFQSYGYQPYRPYQARGSGRPFLGKNTSINILNPPLHILTRPNPKKGENDTFLSPSNPSNNVGPETNESFPVPFRPRPEPPVPEGRQQREQKKLDTQATEAPVGEYAMINLTKWGPDFIAGRVSSCVDAWAKITSDPHILKNIRSYKLEFTEPPIQVRPLPEIRFSEGERAFVRKEIIELLGKKVLTRAHESGEFVSIIFLREKREKGKYRMILNLKHLNKYIEKKHFKMETLQTTLALITPGCTFMSFDFSDAYYSCSVFYPHRKYLRFMFEGQLYEFTCLPNELSSAPRFFTKIMKVA